MITGKKHLWAVCLSLAAASPTLAEVTLSTKDGSLQVSGELISFDGTSYRIRTDLGLFSVPAGSVDCTGSECPGAGGVATGQTIRGTGSDILLSTLLHEAIRSYGRDAQAGVKIESNDQGMTSYVLTGFGGDLIAEFDMTPAQPSTSFDALLAGEASVAFTSRRMTNPEVEKFIDAGFGDPTQAEQERIIAQDGLVAVVSPRNPVRTLTAIQLEGIYSGRITNWSEVGGPNAPIRAIAPADGTGEADFFFETILDPEFSEFGGSIERVDSAADVANLVAQDDRAIGFTSTALTEGAATIALAGECGLEIEATPFNIKSEDYPLSRRLYAYTPVAGGTRDQLSEFIEMLESEAGQEIAASTNFISLTADATSLDGQGRRVTFALADRAQAGEERNLRGFAEQVVKADRLSTTFRFSSGSSQLDNKAQADAQRLADYLARPENANREVLLIGFTDSIGQSDVNTVLSVRRAQQVLAEILAAAGNRVNDDRILVMGYGAAAPIACNETDGGRQLNRRVEVWLR